MIKVDTNSLIDAIKFVRPCVSRDTNRPALQGVHMKQVDDNKLLIEACDGYRMAQIKIDILETDQDTRFEALTLPIKLTKSIVATRLSADGDYLAVVNDATGESFTKRLISEKYIDLDAVVPTDAPSSEICLNPRFVKDMAQSFVGIQDAGVKRGLIMQCHGEMGMVVCIQPRDKTALIGLLPLRM